MPLAPPPSPPETPTTARARFAGRTRAADPLPSADDRRPPPCVPRRGPVDTGGGVSATFRPSDRRRAVRPAAPRPAVPTRGRRRRDSRAETDDPAGGPALLWPRPPPGRRVRGDRR